MQVLSRPPAPTSAPAAPAAPSAWAYRPTGGAQAFAIEQDAELTVRADTLVRRDSSGSRLEVTYALQPGTGRLSGNVTAFTVKSGAQPPAPVAGLPLPFAFSASYSVSGRQPTLDAPAERTTCSSPARSVAQSLRDLWFRAPDSLRVGTTWADSGSFVVCRDGIPLQVTAFRTFRVVATSERDGRRELAVVRTSRLSVAAESRRGDDTTRVSGTGSGEMTYTLDTGASRLVSAHGTATLDLFLRAAARSHSVRQVSAIRVLARPR